MTKTIMLEPESIITAVILRMFQYTFYSSAHCIEVMCLLVLWSRPTAWISHHGHVPNLYTYLLFSFVLTQVNWSLVTIFKESICLAESVK